MATEETDSNWDDLAEDLGLKTEAPKPAPKPAAPPPARFERRDDPEPEPEPDEPFGGEADDEIGSAPEPLFDPGPDEVASEEDFEDGDDGETAENTDESPAADGQEAGRKKRRRRRRKKKKGGPEEAVADSAEAETPAEAGDGGEDDGVEEGEAPSEIEGDDDEAAVPSAMDEEMDADAAQPRHEWNVMSWNDLVGKLYRPS